MLILVRKLLIKVPDWRSTQQLCGKHYKQEVFWMRLQQRKSLVLNYEERNRSWMKNIPAQTWTIFFYGVKDYWRQNPMSASVFSHLMTSPGDKRWAVCQPKWRAQQIAISHPQSFDDSHVKSTAHRGRRYKAVEHNRFNNGWKGRTALTGSYLTLRKLVLESWRWMVPEQTSDGLRRNKTASKNATILR